MESYVGNLINKNNLSLKDVGECLKLPIPMLEDMSSKSKWTILNSYHIDDNEYESIIQKIRKLIKTKTEKTNKEPVMVIVSDPGATIENLDEEMKKFVFKEENKKEDKIMLDKINELNLLAYPTLYVPYNVSQYFKKYKELIKYILSDVATSDKDIIDYLNLTTRKGNSWWKNLGSRGNVIRLSYDEFKKINSDLGISKSSLKYPTMIDFHQDLQTVLKTNNIQEKELVKEFFEYLKIEYDDVTDHTNPSFIMSKHLEKVLDNHNTIIMEKTHTKLISFLLFKGYITENELDEEVINMAKSGRNWNNKNHFNNKMNSQVNNQVQEELDSKNSLKNEIIQKLEKLNIEDLDKVNVLCNTLIKEREKNNQKIASDFLKKMFDEASNKGIDQEMLLKTMHDMIDKK